MLYFEAEHLYLKTLKTHPNIHLQRSAATSEKPYTLLHKNFFTHQNQPSVA